MRIQAVKWLRRPLCFDQPFTQRPFGLFFFLFCTFCDRPFSIHLYIQQSLCPLPARVFLYWDCVCVCECVCMSSGLTTPCPSTLHVAAATTRPGHTGVDLQAHRWKGARFCVFFLVIISQESWLSSGQWRLPQPSTVSGAPRGATVCCWSCPIQRRSRTRGKAQNQSPGEVACPKAWPALSQMTWGAETEVVSFLLGGAWAADPVLWDAPFEEKAGVARETSGHGLESADESRGLRGVRLLLLCPETWPSSC